jgi:hypothetical protein
MSWHIFDGGKSIGLAGSESGVIVRDEEHNDGARITLERDTKNAPFAITCGIYGWMVHTRYFGLEPQAQAEFDSMSTELSKIIATIPLKTAPDVHEKSQAVCESIAEFVRRFP